jgi:hypothetical protein
MKMITFISVVHHLPLRAAWLCLFVLSLAPGESYESESICHEAWLQVGSRHLVRSWTKGGRVGSTMSGTKIR